MTDRQYFILWVNLYGVRNWSGPHGEIKTAKAQVPASARSSMIVLPLTAMTHGEAREARPILDDRELDRPRPRNVETVRAPLLSSAEIRLAAAACTCHHTCAEDPRTACSLSGDWHVHPGEPCPTHPDAPGDR